MTRASKQLGRLIRELRTSRLPAIVAVRKRHGALNVAPPLELPLEEGDVIIAVGAGEALWAVGELLQACSSSDE